MGVPSLNNISELEDFLLRKTYRFFVLILILISAALSGCQQSTEKQVLNTVNDYVKYMNAEDAPSVYMLAYREVRSLGYKNQLQTLFALYDVDYTLEKAEFVNVEDDIAYVDFIMTMIKTDDSDFQNVRLNGTFQLKLENEAWKILLMDYDAETGVEYLQ